MADKKQFDEFLGGSQSLPHEVPIMNFVASRIHEISAMTYSIENPKQTKLIFQKLPVYMRRRVMSHNVKRLPRRLREAHLAQMAKSANGKNLSSTNKRPSRKYRRRPHNLLSEYNRRQCNKIWLETHIWHAKRFHMIDKWGCRIPNYPNDKSFRANYRAITKYCMLQDISYYTCIEITGEENLLKTTLKMHCNPLMLTFAAKKYINGHREGTLMFFKKNSYPYSPIGNVHFFWKPNELNIKTIWIWVHPAFYNDFLTEIISSFEFKLDNAEQNSVDASYVANCFYANDQGCKMIILKNTLNRFRLCGPLTLKILMEALHLPSLIKSDSCSEIDCIITGEQDLNKTSVDKNVLPSTEDMAIDETFSIFKDSNTQESCNKKWHVEYYKNHENIEIFKTQRQLWKTLKFVESSNYLPTNMIMGITVLDPRFYLPDKRMKCKTETFSQLMSIDQLPINANCSPIWDMQIRHIVSNSCVSTRTINELRSKCLIPGISNDKYFDENIIAKIPILLIQKPGTISGLGSGMDIIIPTKWAMPFWLALLMRCARVGALRESKSIAFESLNSNAPDINDPDSSVYVKEALNTKEKLTKKYFCYPPNRRVNFTKFGIRSPFYCDWKNLMKDWSNTENFYVLRNRELLLLLQTNICSFIKNKNKNLSIQNTQFKNFEEYQNCLIHVQVSMLRKGSPKKFAIICIPTPEDLKKCETNENWIGPIEKYHIDPNEKSRKVLRKNHLALLKRLKRQRIRQKKTIKYSKGNLIENSNNLSCRKIILDQFEKMSKLYLPECTEVRYSCDREVMGYLTTGDFSFSQAKGVGIGYITLSSLILILKRKSNIVLVRNTQTRQYRLAKLDILGI